MGKARQDHVSLAQRLHERCWAREVRDLSCLWLACDLGHTTASWAPVSPFTQFMSKLLATLERHGSSPLRASRGSPSPELPNGLVYSTDSLKAFALLPNAFFHLSTFRNQTPTSFPSPRAILSAQEMEIPSSSLRSESQT